MSKAEILRYSIIDRVLSITDLDYLRALNRNVQPAGEPVYKLSAQQRILPEQSLKEANTGKVISHEDLENVNF